MSATKLHLLLKDRFHSLGFIWSKRLTYSRQVGDCIQYVLIDPKGHPDEYTLASGLRHITSQFPALALIGPSSGSSDLISPLHNLIQFKARICVGKVSPTELECAEKIITLTQKHILPWFDLYVSEDRLLADKDLLRLDATNWRKGEVAQMSEITAKLIGRH